MLHDFLAANRADLIRRCRAKVASRAAPKATPAELEHGIPLFLDQLVATLRARQQQPRIERRLAVRPIDPHTERRHADAIRRVDAIGSTATRHGRELLTHGFTIDQVVHDYGDLCQAVTALACESGTAIGADEFQTLNGCLDDAIAAAVTEFSARHESAAAGRNIAVSDERARVLLNELQEHVQAASVAIAAVKAGNVGLKGATGAVLDLTLISMRTLIERSLGVQGIPARAFGRR